MMIFAECLALYGFIIAIVLVTGWTRPAASIVGLNKQLSSTTDKQPKITKFVVHTTRQPRQNSGWRQTDTTEPPLNWLQTRLPLPPTLVKAFLHPNANCKPLKKIHNLYFLLSFLPKTQITPCILHFLHILFIFQPILFCKHSLYYCIYILMASNLIHTCPFKAKQKTKTNQNNPKISLRGFGLK